jgi:hypothetical protein
MLHGVDGRSGHAARRRAAAEGMSSMRTTSRFPIALLLAALLATAAAPAASAMPASPLGMLDGFGQVLASWWAALTGDAGGRHGAVAASEVAPRLDPDGNEVAPSIDPNGNEVAPSLDPDGNEVAPRLDPNG